LSLTDQWILSRLSTVSKEVEASLEAYDISTAGDTIYHFVWDEFCNWYLEAAKVEPNIKVLRYVLAEILKLTHPLCPFITQQCWQELFSDSLIIDEAFPSEKFSNEAAVAQFSTVQNIVGAIRTIRAEKNLNPKDKVAASIKSDAEHVKSAVPLIMALGNLSELVVALNVKKGENVATIVAEGLEIFITVPFDADAETARIEKLKAELVQKIEGLKGRLSNSSYTDKAPEHLVAQTRDQLAQAQSELEKLS
jgi:valyl-tRNA synthetase